MCGSFIKAKKCMIPFLDHSIKNRPFYLTLYRRVIVVKTPFLRHPQPTINIEGRFLQYLQVILKLSLQNYYKI